MALPSGAAAIAGIGHTEFSKNSGRSELQLAAEAVRTAIPGRRPRRRPTSTAWSRLSRTPTTSCNSYAPSASLRSVGLPVRLLVEAGVRLPSNTPLLPSFRGRPTPS